jgi:chemotaxis protein MotA
MNLIVGILLVLGSVAGGYVLSHGNLLTLWQPYELLVIGGAAFGAFVIANPGKLIKATMACIPMLLKGSKYKKGLYLDALALLYDLLQKARREGLMAIESDVEDPGNSPIFKKYPTVAADHHVTEFITDYLRMMVTGNLNAHEIETLMDSEIDTHHHEAHAPVMALQRVAGGLPAFGIVAAVLGVVNTMGSVGQPPAVLGGMIGSALVGTFLGILLSYAFAEPLAGLLEQKVEEGTKELQCIKTILLASMQGYAPQVAIEFGRKVLYHTDRPSFSELESHVKKKK